MSYAQQVMNAWYAGLAFAAAAVVFFVLTHRSEDHGPMLWQTWRDRYLMSRDERRARRVAEIEPVREGGSTGSNAPVLPQQNQVEPVEPAPVEPAREPVILHNLSRSSLIALLAVQRNDHGAWRFSKNQIAAFVGGTKAEVLKEIDLYRGQPKAPARADRPANGWGN